MAAVPSTIIEETIEIEGATGVLAGLSADGAWYGDEEEVDEEVEAMEDGAFDPFDFEDMPVDDSKALAAQLLGDCLRLRFGCAAWVEFVGVRQAARERAQLVVSRNSLRAITTWRGYVEEVHAASEMLQTAVGRWVHQEQWRVTYAWVAHCEGCGAASALARLVETSLANGGPDVRRVMATWVAWWTERVEWLEEQKAVDTAEREAREASRLRPRVEVSLREGVWPFDDGADSDDEAAAALEGLDSLDNHVEELERKAALRKRKLVTVVRHWSRRTARRSALLALLNSAAEHVAGVAPQRAWRAWCVYAGLRRAALEQVELVMHYWSRREYAVGFEGLRSCWLSRQAARSLLAESLKSWRMLGLRQGLGAWIERRRDSQVLTKATRTFALGAMRAAHTRWKVMAKGRRDMKKARKIGRRRSRRVGYKVWRRAAKVTKARGGADVRAANADKFRRSKDAERLLLATLEWALLASNGSRATELKKRAVGHWVRMPTVRGFRRWVHALQVFQTEIRRARLVANLLDRHKSEMVQAWMQWRQAGAQWTRAREHAHFMLPMLALARWRALLKRREGAIKRKMDVVYFAKRVRRPNEMRRLLSRWRSLSLALLAEKDRRARQRKQEQRRDRKQRVDELLQEQRRASKKQSLLLRGVTKGVEASREAAATQAEISHNLPLDAPRPARVDPSAGDDDTAARMDSLIAAADAMRSAPLPHYRPSPRPQKQWKSPKLPVLPDTPYFRGEGVRPGQPGRAYWDPEPEPDPFTPERLLLPHPPVDAARVMGDAQRSSPRAKKARSRRVGGGRFGHGDDPDGEWGEEMGYRVPAEGHESPQGGAAVL